MTRRFSRIGRDRVDRINLNAGLARNLLEDLGYSADYPEAKAMGVAIGGWRAYLPRADASRSEAKIIAPNGRICQLDADKVVASGAIDLLRQHRNYSFADAVRHLEETYLGIHDIDDAALRRARHLPTERRLAAEVEEARRRAEDKDKPRAEQPGLQPGAARDRTPEEALREARRRFAQGEPDPGTGYLVTHRHIDPAIVRRFGQDRGREAVLRYDAARDEVMILHLNAEGRFTTYEYRGGVTRFNRTGSRGNAAGCLVGLGIFGDPVAARRLVVVESGIEALSCLEIKTSNRGAEVGDDACYLSTAGGPKPEQLDRIAAWALASGASVVVAYNDDEAGRSFTKRATEALIERGVDPSRIDAMFPPAWDWNLALKLTKKAEDREVLRWRKAQEGVSG
ncbi:toprim domain-containing protein [Roseomonas chloroacetimidivorans]|uniref:toprim domain-containing protein n=1 Tax=Roseomonas chloroacetimidivorans TaxID=1766656 RepID=UPI003C75C8AB